MRAWATMYATLLALLVSGCAGGPGGGPDGTPATTEAPRLPTKQVFEREGNDALCSRVLSGSTTYRFTVEPGYDQIEVAWHASGVGQVGFEIRAPDGKAVAGKPDENPGDQPCNHGHSGGAEPHDATPGEYAITVRATGVVGWHLVVNEMQKGAEGGAHGH